MQQQPFFSRPLVNLFFLSVKIAVCKEQQQQCSCCWHALLCKFRHIEIYLLGRFLPRETRLAHYNFCLQKWTYFLLLDKRGIDLCTLIWEVSFFSRYTPRWSHDHKCGSLAVAAFAECFYAKAWEGVLPWLLPQVTRLILYLRCHTVSFLLRSQKLCY